MAFVHGLVAALLAVMPQAGQADAPVFDSITAIAAPSAPAAQEPALFALPDGRLAMSWTEADGAGAAVRMALLDGDRWDGPYTVHSAADLFLNWADFPRIAVLGDGTIAVHWLARSGAGSFDYDVNIALSRDGGQSWSAALVPHRESGSGQHGFVSLLPVMKDRLAVIWLDGRAYGRKRLGENGQPLPDAMQLRATELASSGVLEADVPIDIQVCSCCQTSASLAGDGTILAAYRDRTDGEIRDISVVRMKHGVWSDPVRVHADDWEISGCPVNGPAIDAAGASAVVAWFTGAREIPAVKVAFSADAGRTFGPATRIDMGDPAGRVDVLLLDDASAVVSWVEWLDDSEVLMACRIAPDADCSARQRVATGNDVANFPQIARSGKDIYLAWTQPLDDDLAATEIRILRARLLD